MIITFLFAQREIPATVVIHLILELLHRLGLPGRNEGFISWSGVMNQ